MPEARAALGGALQRVADASDTATAGLDLQSQVLEAALRVHEHDGDGACLVCGVGRADGVAAQDYATKNDQSRRSAPTTAKIAPDGCRQRV
ncbi:hypothetical protein ACWGST_05960 [Agromyces sp. NPDC055520]